MRIYRYKQADQKNLDPLETAAKTQLDPKPAARSRIKTIAERGAMLTETALLTAMIAVVCIVALAGVAMGIQQAFCRSLDINGGDNHFYEFAIKQCQTLDGDGGYHFAW